MIPPRSAATRRIASPSGDAAGTPDTKSLRNSGIGDYLLLLVGIARQSEGFHAHSVLGDRAGLEIEFLDQSLEQRRHVNAVLQLEHFLARQDLDARMRREGDSA